MTRPSREAVNKRAARRADSLAKLAKKGTNRALLLELARVDFAVEDGLVMLRQAMADSATGVEARALLESLNKVMMRWQVLAFSAGILIDTVARRSATSKKAEELAALRHEFYGEEEDAHA